MNMDFMKVQDGWSSTDDRYMLEAACDPWSTRPTETVEWAVRVRMFGESSWTTLTVMPTFYDAKRFAEVDAVLPVFNVDGLCRWCGTEETYLEEVPRGWFGCRLCDGQSVPADDLSWEDLEAFDDPA
jgi:alpha-D-ribose 1-methylphosphonate 5-phosphate C-P lyase